MSIQKDLMKRKVLFLASWYPTRINPTNGNFIEKHAECIALSNDVRLIHVCLDPNQQERISQEITNKPFFSQIIYLNKSSIPFLAKPINYYRIFDVYLKAIKAIIEQGFSPQVVHANVIFPIGVIALMLKWRYKIPYIITEHWTGFLSYSKVKIGRIQKLMMRLIATNSSCLCPVSEDLKNAMIKCGLKAAYKVIPNVVDTHIFVPNIIEKRNSRARILHISSLKEEQKNFRLLLQALANIRKLKSDFELHVASDGIWEQYQHEIETLELHNHIFFHGNLSTYSVAELMNTADFFVLTSNYENLPCVLVESLACGVPVISTRVGGVAEIINEENGILIPPNDIESLTNAILKMLDNYSIYDNEKMHQNAVAQFSYEAISKVYSGLYEDIIIN